MTERRYRWIERRLPACELRRPPPCRPIESDHHFPCDRCRCVYRKKRLLAHHQLKEHGFNVRCEYCNKRYAKFAKLLAHQIHHHNDKQVICPFCKITWGNLKDGDKTNWRKMATHVYGELYYEKIMTMESVKPKTS
ncbi:hypothetical protein WR25_26531 [Diploscapter pachys]|uniref:C2H2-type domain-containing protein n=1 Tax=Diploscapter pachys TaxID=2018661 RepID=A0A2A2JHJ3_9BILA|nr:hypothetical protein WR25_26531 [Diploscapter pachys]